VPDHREDLYTRTYLAYIERDIVRAFGEGAMCRVVDAGCGTGRMAVALALEGHSVTGIDYHRPSLNEARARAKRAKVAIDLIESDLLLSLRQSPSESASIVLCLEVLYTCPDYREILQEIRRILRPGGLLLASVASRFFLLTTLLRKGKLSAAERVATKHEGLLPLARAPAYYRWFTANEAESLLCDLGMDILSVEPIARFYGDGYDGMAGVLDVDALRSHAELDALHRIEGAALPRYPDLAKYIYVAARREAAAG
jgi:SAM-dependent methyltransferase